MHTRLVVGLKCLIGILVVSLLVILHYRFHLEPIIHAQSGASVVISQVYGGGGNSGSTFKNDFIELYNAGSSPVDLSSWSIQYATSSGSRWSKTNLCGILQPGQYYLIQEAGSGGNGLGLPVPDVKDNIAMSSITGKIALVSNQNLLTCGAVSGNCLPSLHIVDFVGYGNSANNYEGSGPTGNLSNTKAALRKSNGLVDTEDNYSDFEVGNPNPRNSGEPSICLASEPAKLRDIQGSAHISPLLNKMVTTSGIVTAKLSNGFYVQDPFPDTNDSTSEAILIFTSSSPGVNIGDAVQVTGRVTEFRPGGSNAPNLSTTQISSPQIEITSSNNPLPEPVIIGTGGRVPPTAIISDDALSGNVEAVDAIFDPDNDGIDFYESLEAMRVQVNNAVVLGPTNDSGEIVVVADYGTGASVRTSRGGIIGQPNDFNPERIIIDDRILRNMPRVNVADSFPGSIKGVMDYSFGNFKLLATEDLPNVEAGNLMREIALPATGNELAVATFNVENLDPNDGVDKFNSLAGLIVNHLGSPDIIALEEVQDNSGPIRDGVVDASQTYQMLIAAIQSWGGPTYQYRDINPVDGKDGGEPGGNIRVGFLFRIDRGLSFVDRPGGTPIDATTVIATPDGPQLSFSPGRIDPTNSVFNASRKPLVGEFTYNNQTLFVIANHFNAKIGDQPLFGRFQPPQRDSETQRHQQAQLVNNFVNEILAVDANANIIVLGDFNDVEFSDTLNILKGGALHNLMDTLPENERYTYVFEGNSQSLDHILVSHHLFSSVSFAYDIVHVNAEFALQDSDHDPQVVRFALEPTYNFEGFFQPVDNLPTINAVSSGRAVPVRFSMGGDRSLNIFASGYPRSKATACDSSLPVDDIEQTVSTSGSRLSYDAQTDQYTYVWKTQKSWARTCRELVIKFNDGTYQRANFKFY